MPLLARMLASPLSVDIRRGAVENLSSLLHARFISTTGRVLVAVGASQGEEIWRRIEPSLPEASVFARSSRIARTTSSGSGAPTPTEWLRTRFC